MRFIGGRSGMQRRCWEGSEGGWAAGAVCGFGCDRWKEAAAGDGGGEASGYDFGRDRILHVHLGLQGDFTEGSGPLPVVKGALRLRMWNAAAVKRPAVEGASRPHRWYSEDDGTGSLEANKIAWVELRGRWIAPSTRRRCGRS